MHLTHSQSFPCLVNPTQTQGGAVSLEMVLDETAGSQFGSLDLRHFKLIKGIDLL